MKKKTFIAVCMFALWMALILPAMPSSVQAAKGGGGVRVSAPNSLPAPKAVTPITGTGTKAGQYETHPGSAAQGGKPAGQYEPDDVFVPSGQRHAWCRPLCRRHVPGQYAQPFLWLGVPGLGRRHPRIVSEYFHFLSGHQRHNFPLALASQPSKQVTYGRIIYERTGHFAAHRFHGSASRRVDDRQFAL